MDPITAALVAAVAKLAEPAIKDAYQGLKSLIVKKLGAKHEVVSAVESLEQKPDSTGRRQTLEEEVKGAGVENDDEILAAARSLIEKVKATPGGEITCGKLSPAIGIFFQARATSTSAANRNLGAGRWQLPKFARRSSATITSSPRPVTSG